MAYIPPGNVPGVTDLAYFLVAVPDDDAYRQAALGAYLDMANRWAWGAETESSDSPEIQQQWLDAIDDTLEAWSMGGFATLLGHIDDVESLLEAIKAMPAGCCPDNLTYFTPTPQPDPGDRYETGPYPATWGDGETVVDQADYDEILCAQAHRYVDYLVDIGDQLDVQVAQAVMVVAGIVTVLGVLSGAGLLVAVNYGFAATVVSGIVAGATTALFGDASTAIETARDSVVCAILTGNAQNVLDIIEANISALGFSLFFEHIDYQSAINTMLSGTANGEFLPVLRDDTCSCGYEYDETFDFNLSGEGFSFGSRTDWSDPDDLIRMHPVVGSSPEPTAIDCTRTNLGVKAGLGNVAMYADLVTMDIIQGDIGDYMALGKEVEVTVRYEDSSYDTTVFTSYGTSLSVTVDPTKELEASVPQWLNLRGKANGSSTQGNIFIDNIRVGFHT